jgi:N-methyl-L-tryptophan oxidase
VTNRAKTYDTIILGGGSMGLAAAYELVNRNQSVLVLDRYEAPHTFGSHHGSTRLIRIAYAEGEAYVPLAKRARELWLNLESEQYRAFDRTAERLFAPIGVVSVLHPAAQSIEEIEACVRTHNLPFERLTAEEAMLRWPGLSIPDDYVVHFDPDGGVLFSEACLRAYKRLCQAQGVAFQFGGSLRHLEIQHESVTVHWGDDTFSGSSLIIATGAGTPDILKRFFPDWQVPLQPIRKVFAWYQPQDQPTSDSIGFRGAATNPRTLYDAPHFPGFCVETPQAWFYGFPNFGDGVKVGRHDGGTPCTFDNVDRAFHEGSPEERELRHFLQAFLPGAAGPLKSGAVCMYTMTPDENFVIDTHPEHGHVYLAAGFSGHGFKFASAVGEALAEWVCRGAPTLDLSLFRAQRFSVRQKPRRASP